jgi:hypothetical protein
MGMPGETAAGSAGTCGAAYTPALFRAKSLKMKVERKRESQSPQPLLRRRRHAARDQAKNRRQRAA